MNQCDLLFNGKLFELKSIKIFFAALAKKFQSRVRRVNDRKNSIIQNLAFSATLHEKNLFCKCGLSLSYLFI